MGVIVDVILPVALAFIMFSLGLGLAPADFLRVVKQPTDLVVGLTCQIALLPAVALLLVSIWPMPAELALGVMILAAAPGGATSNLLTAMARGDVALSISLTAITSLLCIFTVPPIVVLSYAYLFAREVAVPVSLGGIALKLFVMVTVPVILGISLRLFAKSWAIHIEPFAFRASALLFVLVLAAAIYSERDNLVIYFAQCGLITLTLNVVMLLLAYVVAKNFASGPRQRAAISIECGIQGGALAITVSTLLFDGGLAVVPAVTYSLTMYWTAFILIAFLRSPRRTRT
ncbi:MAG: bile acid:sodium symporter family protein [Hyphomicrobiaceae bacterium]